MADRLIFLVGPTAIGKTGISFELAKLIECEIVSCDSMQVYKGMNVGTSKPAKCLLNSIPHHLIDIVEPSEEFSVARFRALAVKAIEEITARRKTPLLVGGSGLYVKVLIDGIFEAPQTDRELRERLEQEAGEFGIEVLYRRLQEADKEGAGKIHANDLRRIIRALEVYEKAKAPISQLRKNTAGLGDKYEVRIFGLDMERAALYRKIDERVELMFAEGLVNETRSLLEGKLSLTASQALGYKEVLGYLDGEYGLEEAKRLVKRDTRHFAKRQLTWFRRDKRIEWITLDDNFDTGETAREIWKRLS
ncbi:MAG: tRNA (adenosine(37)-N6)-dimethylallyltransferase MiaA [Candidatus Omnitrophica bacterium]|nr:tRNA (adenosine(37)-N6)-dimethylallyltransferase MiaA [Candidatus Omnitrophota bacterium]MDD5310522.1 tRNA (adenosine(37)-N6)-dimethylallyltransferase MiaA [Candidatus Omnitrophota bacterium]MDD5546052.1 tRNA (adenosine(37)-N6)-dimethylallyltransferase MiaA [Candidatus Omnitrophota bacterium]